MAGADRVDVQPLHEPDVGLGLLAGHHPTLQAELVPVHAVEDHAAAVEPAAGRPRCANRRTPDPLRDRLGQRPDASRTSSVEVVQVRVLRAPQPRARRCGRTSRRRRVGSSPTPSSRASDRCPSPARTTRTRTVGLGEVVGDVGRRPGGPRRAPPGRRYSTTSRNRPENRKKSWSSSHDPALHLTTCAARRFSPVDQGVGEVELRRGEAVGRVARRSAPFSHTAIGALRAVEARRSAARRARAGARG